ncbi:hypothetical protein B0T24DRAFT_231443 [Lasiosphaeria ovina]|uniref:Uncharacterized protein n=1 Tax=Lasiosphaeria ovina TaxID=92902 RepID=A0AAE0KHJ2_9PEZI|nr:hypothetical protein B0T24DRAFT_231443 [Lasiosphaeria ovina]
MTAQPRVCQRAGQGKQRSPAPRATRRPRTKEQPEEPETSRETLVNLPTDTRTRSFVAQTADWAAVHVPSVSVRNHSLGTDPARRQPACSTYSGKTIDMACMAFWSRMPASEVGLAFPGSQGCGCGEVRLCRRCLCLFHTRLNLPKAVGWSVGQLQKRNGVVMLVRRYDARGYYPPAPSPTPSFRFGFAFLLSASVPRLVSASGGGFQLSTSDRYIGITSRWSDNEMSRALSSPELLALRSSELLWSAVSQS